MNDFDPAHRQDGHAVRFDWGPVGAAATATAHAVVVDVLSFTTTVTVAAEHGVEVFPFEWRDSRAAEHAMRHGAKLAVGRFEARGLEGRHVSLSPASVAADPDLTRLVLPSPNGSTICFRLAEEGTTVLAASLRNRRAVAEHLARGFFRDRSEPELTVIAAGERWPDGSLRPCVEDLWGAGGVLAALADLGVEGFSPEARVAEAAFRSAEGSLAEELPDLAGGRELVEVGFADDVRIAGELDVSRVVPVLNGESFRAEG